MILYGKVVIFLVSLIIWFGLIGPWCISIDETLINIGYTIITIILAYPSVKTGIKISKEIYNEIQKISNL